MTQCAFCDSTDTNDFFIPKAEALESGGTALTLCHYHQESLYRLLAVVVTIKPCPKCNGDGVIVVKVEGNYIGKKICQFCGGSRIDPRFGKTM